jgi:hypothetical protein
MPCGYLESFFIKEAMGYPRAGRASIERLKMMAAQYSPMLDG